MGTRHLSCSARVPIGEANGVKVYASTEFLRYYEEGRDRMGGDTALTNVELEQSALSSAFTIFNKSQQPPQKKVEQGAYMTVTRGIDRFTVALDIEALKAAILPFIPRHQQQKHRPDDSSAVLAGRIFGAR